MGIPIPSAILPLSSPAAGLLPAGWALPRELMPVHDAPLLQFALEEAAAAGVRRLVVVTHGTDSAIEDYLRPDRPSAPSSRIAGAAGVAERMARLPPDLAMEIRILRLDGPWSLGRAVLEARSHVLPGPVAVLQPEDLIFGRPCAVELGEAWTVVGGAHLLAVTPASPAETARSGFLRAEGPADGRTIRASGFIRDSSAASRLAVVGRYLLDERIFDDLAALPPVEDGAISLAEAITEGSIDIGLFGMRVSGRRFDCGTPGGLLAAATFRARDAGAAVAMRETG